jgi:hypothetical protein
VFGYPNPNLQSYLFSHRYPNPNLQSYLFSHRYPNPNLQSYLFFHRYPNPNLQSYLKLILQLNFSFYSLSNSKLCYTNHN